MAFQQRSSGSESRAADMHRKHATFVDLQRIVASPQQHLTAAHPRGRWPYIGEQSETPQGKGISAVDLDIGTAGDGLAPASVVAVDWRVDRRRLQADSGLVTAAQPLDSRVIRRLRIDLESDAAAGFDTEAIGIGDDGTTARIRA